MKYKLTKAKLQSHSKQHKAKKMHYQVYIPEQRDTQPKNIEEIDY
ncbi:hypothetical protein [Evansella halocellulosilytica]|nr:hypothetical protein [Evansella halocellulosilytica]